jgi:hypothetical protein
LTEEVNEQPGDPSQRGEQDDRDRQHEPFEAAQIPEDISHARSGVVVGKAGDNDEGRKHRQDGIPDQRRRTDLGRGQLPKTVAIEFSAPGETVADAGNEDHQEDQRQKRSPACRPGGD